MKFFQETTEWPDTTPNHIYLLSDNKEYAHGYIKVGTSDLFTFKSKYRFDSRRRKFKEVPNTFGYTEPRPEGQVWEFVGSKGDKYVVEKLDNQYTCSCSGFKFRGKCKHVTEVMEQQGVPNE